MFEENNWQDDDGLSESIARFEGMLKNNASYFFDIDELEELFDYYLDINNKTKALKVVKHAIKIYPDSAQMQLKYAQALAASYKPQLALEVLQSVENTANSVEYYLIKADILNQLRQYSKAIESLKEATKQPLDDIEKEDIFISLAFTYKEINKTDKAADCFKIVINLNPENEIALFELSFIYQEQDKVNEFIIWLNTFIDKYPFSSYAWFILGKSYEFLFKLQKAFEAFDYATVIKEDYTAAHICKADILTELGKTEDAITSYKTALKYQEADSDIYCAIGECYLSLNEYVLALKHFKKANKIDPINIDVWLGFSEAYEQLNDIPSALYYIKKCVSFDKKDTYFLYRYGTIIEKMGYYEEAQSTFSNILEIEPDNDAAILSLSNIYYLQDDLLQAEKVISSFLVNKPEATTVRYRYVAYLIMLNKIESAQDHLYIALSQNKNEVAELFRYLPEIYHTESIINTIEDFEKNNGL